MAFLIGEWRGFERSLLQFGMRSITRARAGRTIAGQNDALYPARALSRDSRTGRSSGAHVESRPDAPVAQLDRVLVSEAKGHRFDSCRARHFREGKLQAAQ